MASSKRKVDYHNRVKLVRVERNLSRQELADLVGVHVQTIGYIERGEFNLSLGLALRLCSALGVSLDAMFSSEPFAPLTSRNLLAARG